MRGPAPDQAGRFDLSHVPIWAEVWCVVVAAPTGSTAATAVEKLDKNGHAKVKSVIR